MKLLYQFAYILLVVLLTGCPSSTGPGEPPPPPPPATTFSLTTSVSPADAGTVDPESGTFDEGESVTVEATAESGFEFVEWTGDQQSADNPLTFTINEDTDITANFQQVASSEYTMKLNVADSLFDQDLQFGQDPDATATFDQGIDRESPPPPPVGSLDSFFKLPSDSLFFDFRNSATESITWNLQLQPGQGDSLFFEWVLDETSLNGSITLRNSTSTIVIDMLTQSSFETDTAGVDSLLIEYQLNN